MLTFPKCNKSYYDIIYTQELDSNHKEVSHMKTVQISLNSIDKVKSFVNDYYSNSMFDFDLISGRYVIDAKSIMGIFSLDLIQADRLSTSMPKHNMDEIHGEFYPYIIK